MSDTKLGHDSSIERTEKALTEEVLFLIQRSEMEEDCLERERMQERITRLIGELFPYSAFGLKRLEQDEEIANRTFIQKRLSVLLKDMTAISKTIIKCAAGILTAGGGLLQALSPMEVASTLRGGSRLLQPGQKYVTGDLERIGGGLSSVGRGVETGGSVVDGYNQADQTKSQFQYELRKKRGDTLSQNEKEDDSRVQKAEQNARDMLAADHNLKQEVRK